MPGAGRDGAVRDPRPGGEASKECLTVSMVRRNDTVPPRPSLCDCSRSRLHRREGGGHGRDLRLPGGVSPEATRVALGVRRRQLVRCTAGAGCLRIPGLCRHFTYEP